MSGQYNRKDHFYNEAKEKGFRSRASFKLMEIDDKYKILKPGFKVLDLGAWPGGWTQIAQSKVGDRGLVVGIDLVEIEDFGAKNIKLIKGDVRDEECLRTAKKAAGGDFDVVISDMSPKLTGTPEVDRIAAVSCAELALWASQQALKAGGALVIKVFKGNETEVFVKSMRPLFNKVVRTELKSTRKSSNEFYLINLGFKNTPHSS